MRIAGYCIVLLILSALLSTLIGVSGCANIIPPTGGPRDSLPPRLLHVNPPDSALHLNNKTILFSFDEYLDIKDVQQNLVVNPVPKSMPTVESKLRTMTVKLKDTLQPNTTYSLNFGKSVRDVNEGNILKNFTYVFSTGSYIDSMEFSGKVVLAISGKVDSTLTVVLHEKLDDSAAAKNRPRYATTIDSLGNFNFKYLAPGTYALYALKDEGGSKKYMSSSQLFGFLDSPVVIGQYNKSVTIYAYADTASVKPVKKAAPVVQKPKAREKEKEKDTRLIVQLNIANNQADLLSNLEFQFQTPLKFLDTAQVQFTDDKFNPIHGYKLIEDTDSKRILVDYKLEAGAGYKFILGKDFAEDTLGKKLLKTDTISFKAKEEADYGSLKIRFANLNLARNPVLQFVQKESVRMIRVLNANDFYEKLVSTGRI